MACEDKAESLRKVIGGQVSGWVGSRYAVLLLEIGVLSRMEELRPDWLLGGSPSLVFNQALKSRG